MVSFLLQTIDFNTWTNVTLSPSFLIALGTSWLSSIIIYLIIGCIARGRSSSGNVYSKPMIAFPNFWFGFIVFSLILPALLLGLVIFPLWLKFI